jgi:hypothetical protein
MYFLDWSLCADAGYSWQLVDRVNSVCGWMLEIVNCRDDLKDFKFFKKMGSRKYIRWVGGNRRLCKDYEGLIK